MTQEEILLAERSDWVRRTLSAKNRWINVDILYNEYMKELVDREESDEHDSVTRGEFCHWMRFSVAFVEFTISKNSRNYRLKQEEPCTLSAIGQRVAKLSGYLLNGKNTINQ